MIQERPFIKKVQSYAFYRKIAQGQFCEIFEAEKQSGQNLEIGTSMIQQNAIVAIKQISKQKINQNQAGTLLQSYTQENKTKSSQTQAIQFQLNKHPNIVLFVEILETSNNYYIVAQFCNGGNLRQLFKQVNYKLEERQVQLIAAQIINGLRYLRQFNTLHFNINPDNILINIEDQQQIYKISGFTHATSYEEKQKVKINNVKSLYCAPEVSNNQTQDYKSDLWSFGVIVYELLTGELKGVNNQKLIEMFNNISQILASDLKISENAKSFLKAILVIDLNQRKDVEEMFSHP